MQAWNIIDAFCVLRFWNDVSGFSDAMRNSCFAWWSEHNDVSSTVLFIIIFCNAWEDANNLRIEYKSPRPNCLSWLNVWTKGFFFSPRLWNYIVLINLVVLVLKVICFGLVWYMRFRSYESENACLVWRKVKPTRFTANHLTLLKFDESSLVNQNVVLHLFPQVYWSNKKDISA